MSLKNPATDRDRGWWWWWWWEGGDPPGPSHSRQQPGDCRVTRGAAQAPGVCGSAALGCLRRRPSATATTDLIPSSLGQRCREGERGAPQRPEEPRRCSEGAGPGEVRVRAAPAPGRRRVTQHGPPLGRPPARLQPRAAESRSSAPGCAPPAVVALSDLDLRRHGCSPVSATPQEAGRALVGMSHALAVHEMASNPSVHFGSLLATPPPTPPHPTPPRRPPHPTHPRRKGGQTAACTPPRSDLGRGHVRALVAHSGFLHGGRLPTPTPGPQGGLFILFPPGCLRTAFSPLRLYPSVGNGTIWRCVCTKKLNKRFVELCDCRSLSPSLRWCPFVTRTCSSEHLLGAVSGLFC